MSVSLIFFVIAAVCFFLDAFRVNGPLSWTPAGFGCLTIALFLM